MVSSDGMTDSGGSVSSAVVRVRPVEVAITFRPLICAASAVAETPNLAARSLMAAADERAVPLSLEGSMTSQASGTANRTCPERDPTHWSPAGRAGWAATAGAAGDGSLGFEGAEAVAVTAADEVATAGLGGAPELTSGMAVLHPPSATEAATTTTDLTVPPNDMRAG